jgi:RTX calcium-binding nonapeptide repeat (4 copies)
VARPFWLKLFGKTAEMTTDQVREAILSGDFMARLADSGDFPRGADRADILGSIRASIAADRAAREQGDAEAGTQPGPASAELYVLTASDLAGSADRLYTLQVGTIPFAGNMVFNATSGNVVFQTIVYDPPPERDPTEGFSGGWVERRLLVENNAAMPIFVVNDSSFGEMDRLAPFPVLDPRLDTLALSGDFSGGFTLSSNPAEVGQLLLARGHDYVLSADETFVAAGQSLVVDGQALGEGNHVMFDGSAETDGRFAFHGSDSDDYFFGGAGADSIRGLGGADVLSGGGGADTFLYVGAGDSSGADFDLLADFDPAVDRIDLPGAVTGFAAAVTSGSLSDASFDDDLGAALGGLGAGQAVWFAPDAGDRAGQIFLVVDGNGIAGYQEGEDYVFGIAGSPLADLTGHTGFFV